ncbi:MAG: hypothetical protein COA33_000710 [Fluviicola sp.]|nr:hypothetical protein [Fluviicola sp.]
MSKKFKISGKVINYLKMAVTGITIEAWDKDLMFDDYLGSAITNKKGEFTIEFDDSKFKELFLDNCPDVFFKIYKNKKLIHSTEKDVIINADQKTKVTICIPQKATTEEGQSMDKRLINGRLITANDEAVVANIELYEVNLNGETCLNSTKSNKTGSYQFECKWNNEHKPDLQVMASEGKKIIAFSRVYYNTSKDLTIDLIVDNKEFVGSPTYTRLNN